MIWISLSPRRPLAVVALVIAVVWNIKVLEGLPLAVRVVPP